MQFGNVYDNKMNSGRNTLTLDCFNWYTNRNCKVI